MNRVYEWAVRLKDLVSPSLQRVSATYSRTVSGMDRLTARVQSGFSRAAQSVDQLRRKLNFGKESSSIDSLNAKLDQLTKRRNISVDTSEIKKLNREIQATEKEMQRLQRMGASGGGGPGGFVSNLVSAAMPALGAAAIVAGVTTFASMGISREQTQMAYEQFVRDKQTTQQLIAEQNRFADVTPFTNEEVMGAGRNFLAYGFNPKEIIKQERLVGDVAAGVQANFGELSQIYGKLKSKGFADTGDLWQFADRGIPILDALSKSLGKSKDEILKMAENRQIKFTDIENAFESMTSKGGMFEGMLDKMSQSVGGKLSTFVGTVQNKFGMLAEALNPLVAMLLDVGQGLFTALDPVFGALMNLFKAFEPLFTAIGNLLKLFGLSGDSAGLLTILMHGLAMAINAVAFIVNLLSNVIAFLVSNPVSAFIVAAGLIILNLGTIVGWLISMVTWLAGGIASVWAFAESWWAANSAMLACPAVWIVAAIAAIVAGIMWAWDNVDGFREALIRLWEVAKSVFSSIGKAWDALMKGDFSGVAKAFSDGIKQGMANADVRIKADKAKRAAASAPKVPQPPKQPGMAKPGAAGAGGGKPGTGGGKSVGDAAGLNATTGGTKSTTITINLKSLVENIRIQASGVQEGLDDMEGQVTDTLLRVLNSANAMATD